MNKADTEKELAMMEGAMEWPMWPFLPLKKPPVIAGPWPEFGCLVDLGDPDRKYKIRPVVYDHSPFSETPFNPMNVKAKFDSFEELIAAGWKVD